MFAVSIRTFKTFLVPTASVFLTTLISCGTNQAERDESGSDAQAKSRGVSNVLVLMYHDIIPNPAPTGYKAAPDDVLLSNFIAQLNWLQNNGYQTISMKEMSDNVRSGTAFTGKKVLLTFDDNYYGIWKNGLPELTKRNMKGTIFAHTQYVRPDNQAVSYAGTRPKASWNEIVQAETTWGGGNLFRWESHTVTHSNLTTLPTSGVRNELVNSKAKIETEFRTRLGNENYKNLISGSNKILTPEGNKRVAGIAYPVGAYDARVAPIAQEAGYEIGFEVGFDETFGNARYALPRMGVGLRIKNLSDFATNISYYNANRQ